jgi:hypothetical protein
MWGDDQLTRFCYPIADYLGVKIQCLKWRMLVNTMLIPATFAAAIA